MYAILILYTEPKRPIINPQLDLFAWLDTQQFPPLFPAKVVDRITLMLPEKCRLVEEFRLPDDTWEFISWQVEEKVMPWCVPSTRTGSIGQSWPISTRCSIWCESWSSYLTWITGVAPPLRITVQPLLSTF